MELTGAVTAIKSGLDLLEKLHSLYKRYVQKLPTGKDKEEGEKALMEAEKNMAVARAEIAQGLGFVLCRRHFPPGVMIRIGPEQYNQWQCVVCQNKNPSDQDIRQEESYDPFSS
jgi:hypothetical protein